MEDMVIDPKLVECPYNLGEDKRYYAFTRGTAAHASITNGVNGYESLSDYFVETITGKHNQDISCLVVGPKGSGKSNTVLSISYACAVKLAKKMGGEWQDYYNLHELTACILEERANELMNLQRRFVIKNFDDISLGWNARNWRDEDNSIKNDIFTINRTDNCIQFFSVPNQFLLDKVPRSLVSHYIEMDRQYFNRGFVTIKLFKPVTLFRQKDKIINPYLSINGKKYESYLIPKPPQELSDDYDILRRKAKELAMKRRAELRDETLIKGHGQTIAEKKHAAWNAWMGRVAPEIETCVNSGLSAERAMYKIASKTGQTRGAAQYLIREGALERYGFVRN